MTCMLKNEIESPAIKASTQRFIPATKTTT